MRNFTLAIILALGTQYLTAEPYTKQIQPTQSATIQMNQSSKTMPPDPLDKKMADIRSKLTSLGFNIDTIQKVNAKQWRVSVAGWEQKRTTKSTKEMISFYKGHTSTARCQLADPLPKKPTGWDPTDKSQKTGHGMIMIEVDEDGFITFSQKSLNAMGLHANPQKMQGKFGIKQ